MPQPALPNVPWIGSARVDGGEVGQLAALPYFHSAFTLPAAIGCIADHNKALIYDLLFKTSAEARAASASTLFLNLSGSMSRTRESRPI